jgi:hypothetical protein
MEVGQGPNWGCSAKGKKKNLINLFNAPLTATTVIKVVDLKY